MKRLALFGMAALALALVPFAVVFQPITLHPPVAILALAILLFPLLIVMAFAVPRRRWGIALPAMIMLVVLAGCSTAQSVTGAAAPTGPSVAAAAVTDVAKLCAAAAPVLQEAANTPALSPDAANLKAYADSACTTAGAIAATLPTTTIQPSTPTWLSQVLQGLQVAANLAPFVLPLI